MYDYLIVGAGLFGSVFANEARKHGKSCLIVDRREHTGGNIHCDKEEGIYIHRYGAHIFHTDKADVWKYVTDLVDFNMFINSPIANYEGRLYNLPFNMNTFYQMWGVRTPAEAEAKLDEQRREARRKMEAEGVSEPRNLEEQALTLVGNDIYEKLIKGYTQKQWGRPCDELPAFIIRRLPIRLTFDNNYFTDPYQGIPKNGYNELTEKLIGDTEVRLGVDYIANRAELGKIAKKTVFTGAIDEFFDYKLGHLQYRTVRLENETLDMANYQGNAVVNYTSAEVPYTRIIEHKHFDSSALSLPKTIVSREYPMEWKPGMEPYYPVNDAQNNAMAAQYAEMAAAQKDLIFGGRLAKYKYYDMDDVIAAAREAADKEFGK